MAFRPDLIECWLFRVPAPGALPEYLLIRRAPGRIFPGLWQCVTGGVEPGERITDTVLREVREETALGGEAIDAFFDLDLSYEFYDEGPDALVTAAAFAMRVRPDAEPRLSEEHDAMRWEVREAALRLAVWPAYADAMARIESHLIDPAAARWFTLSLEGRRLAR